VTEAMPESTFKYDTDTDYGEPAEEYTGLVIEEIPSSNQTVAAIKKEVEAEGPLQPKTNFP